ncbi:hypothetical protein RhiirA1_458431 [Rhizophagus irregularis]|uniref:Uncharacterized protein n=1 Tax=Rhizophagus irregularis TaxID=588596 RepID=A0A2N0RVV5_9GLOM|nr:hypothetical protein RhiirA1_458431 [Rhizophagus irregularis]
MELLASYDNANYASYLLNFFLVRYKACSGMWKFSQVKSSQLQVHHYEPIGWQLWSSISFEVVFKLDCKPPSKDQTLGIAAAYEFSLLQKW